MSERDLYLILDALDHLTIMDQHIAWGGLEILVVRDAVCLRLSAAIDALSRLNDPVRNELFGDAWPKMRATRNRIAHAYNLVSFGVIAQTIEIDIPPLREKLTSAIAGMAYLYPESPAARDHSTDE